MKQYVLYVVKEKEEVIGAFLLKNGEQPHWEDEKNAYYLWHFVTKFGYPKLGEKMLEFYKQTSLYTDLGLYRDFAKKLADDIQELCELQTHQIIHPFDLLDEKERNDTNSFYRDMTKVPQTSLCYENDLFPTAQAMIAELLRRDKNYSKDRKIEDKIHVCCREHAILLASVLKAKGIPTRVRSGFAKYVTLDNKEAGDHWITEYYNNEEKRWILVDSNMQYDEAILNEFHINFDLNNMPRDKFIFGAEAYLGLRRGKYEVNEIYYASDPRDYGLKGALHGLFYDFHSLMNDEIIFLHIPKYIYDKNFELSEEEYKELDELAELMLNPDENFETRTENSLLCAFIDKAYISFQLKLIYIIV